MLPVHNSHETVPQNPKLRSPYLLPLLTHKERQRPGRLCNVPVRARPPTNKYLYSKRTLQHSPHAKRIRDIFLPNVLFSLQLGRLSDCPNLVLVAVLLQHALRVILPESFGGILAREALQDTVATGMFG